MAKELRALIPLWLVGLGWQAVGLLLGAGDRNAPSTAAIWCVLGGAVSVVGLGALSMGHEFTHRTLEMLLAQPGSRRELWKLKMRALVWLVLLLSGVSALAIGDTWAWNWGGGLRAFELMLIAMGGAMSGLFVAPWMTLLTRSALAGVVFTVALPVVFWQVGETLAYGVYGEAYRLGITAQWSRGWVFFGLLVAHWVAGGVMGYRYFLALEVKGPAGLDLTWPRKACGRELRAGGARPSGRWSRRLWLAWGEKELRLQQVPLLLVAVVTLGWLALVGLRCWRGALDPLGLGPGVVCGAAFVPLLMGALAGAEERQLGLWEWHLMQPRAVWRQWWSKALFVLLLSTGAAWALPVLLGGLLGLGEGAATLEPDGLLDLARPLPVVWLLAAVGLYVSSVARTSLSAVLWSLPLAFVLLNLTGVVWDLGRHTARAFEMLSISTAAGQLATAGQSRFAAGFLIVLALGVIGLGYWNYRTLELRRARVVWHGAILVTYAVVGLVVWGALGRMGMPSAVLSTPVMVPYSPSATTSGPPTLDIQLMKRYGMLPATNEVSTNAHERE